MIEQDEPHHRRLEPDAERTPVAWSRRRRRRRRHFRDGITDRPGSAATHQERPRKEATHVYHHLIVPVSSRFEMDLDWFQVGLKWI